MSTITYLNELETERRAIEAANKDIATPAERADWWDRLAEWWRRRDLGFGDGDGMRRHCLSIARRIRESEAPCDQQ